MKKTLQIKRRFNLERKDYSINYLENSKNNTSEKDVNVSKPSPNPSTTTPPIKPVENKTKDNKNKTNPSVVERMKKRQKIAFWTFFTLLLVGGIAFWQALSVHTPPVRSISKIEAIGPVGTVENPANVKFTFTNNSTFELKKTTSVQVFWGATTAQLSLHIDVFLFQGFEINARYIPYGVGIQIGNYIFDAKTGIGTPINAPDPVIDKTILNQLSTQLVINATAQSAKFNPLFTLISFLPMI